MAYTQSRLQEALLVFKEGRKQDDEKKAEQASRTSRYHLRGLPSHQEPECVLPGPDSDMSSGEENESINTTRLTGRPQLRQYGQGPPARENMSGFLTLVYGSAREKRALKELGAKNSAEGPELENPVIKSMEARARARAELEPYLNGQAGCEARDDCNQADVQLLEPASPQNVPCLPTPPPSQSQSSTDASMMEDEDPNICPVKASTSKVSHPSITGLSTPPATTDLTPDDPMIIDSPSPNQSSPKDNVIVIDSDSEESEESILETRFTANTNWAHPIDFKFCPEPSRPCDFCSNCVFGIEGFGLCKPTFVQYANKPEWHEVKNGHRATGKRPTRMCVICALKRICISMCKRHIFEPIPHLNLSKFPFKDYHSSLASLLEGRAPISPNFKYQMCSLCTRPAFHRCCLAQARSHTLEKVPVEKQKRGCGLYLCSTCLSQAGQHNGNLTKLYVGQHAEPKTMEQESWFQYRADAEFLHPKSLLRMAYSVEDE